MADFGSYVTAALVFVVAALLQDILDTFVSEITAPGCGSNVPTAAVDGAMNCTLVSDAVTWFLAVVLIMLVYVLFNPVIRGGPA